MFAMYYTNHWVVVCFTGTEANKGGGVRKGEEMLPKKVATGLLK